MDDLDRPLFKPNGHYYAEPFFPSFIKSLHMYTVETPDGRVGETLGKWDRWEV